MSDEKALNGVWTDDELAWARALAARVMAPAHGVDMLVPADDPEAHAVVVAAAPLPHAEPEPETESEDQ